MTEQAAQGWTAPAAGQKLKKECMTTMKRVFAVLMTLVLSALCLAGAFAEDNERAAPDFLTPAEFRDRFNSLMGALADQYADKLGQEGVEIVKRDCVITQTDPKGTLVYYGNDDWSLDAGFAYADENAAGETEPALLLNFSISKSLPDGAVFLATYAFQMIIGYEYKDTVSTDDLGKWFDTASDPADVFALPGGYSLNVLRNDSHYQYAVLPPADQNPYLNP